MKNKQEGIDKAVKDALQNMDVPFNAAHWEAMNAALDAEATGDEHFDAEVAAALGGIGAAGVASDWGLFEEMLEEAESIEDSFDQNIENAVNVDAPYNEAHWPLMEQKLIENFSLRYKLMRYKVAEITLTLLFLITVINYVPVQKPLDFLRNLKFPKHNTSTPTTPQNNSTEQLPIASTEATTVAQSIDCELPTHVKSSILATASAANGSLMKDIYPNYAAVSNHAIAPIIDQKAEVITHDNYQIGAALRVADTKLNSNMVLAPLSDDRDWKLERSDVALTLVKVKQRKPLIFQLGMVSIGNVQGVIADYNKVLDFNPANTYTLGYGGGFTFGMKKNDATFQTGLIYSSFAYRPSLPITTTIPADQFEYLIREEVEQVSLDVLEIPLNLQFDLIPDRYKWQSNLLVGVNANVLLNADYKILQDINGVGNNRYEAAERGKFREEALEKDAVFNESAYEQGILNGEKLMDNTYAQFNVGLGVERKLSPFWTIYLQTAYKHQFTNEGIGPNTDRYNTFNLSIGTKVNLNR